MTLKKNLPMETRFSENSFNIDNFLKRARFASLARNCIDKKLKLNQKFLKIFFFFREHRDFSRLRAFIDKSAYEYKFTNLFIFLF